jgi:preprotein translocase subunit SecA
MSTETHAEQHPFEVEIRVRAARQQDAVYAREYVSQDAASTDKALKELVTGISSDTLERMRGVQDGD